VNEVDPDVLTTFAGLLLRDLLIASMEMLL